MLWDIKGIESKGEWVKNASMKPEIIKEMMLKHKDRDILYLDVDAIVRQYPILFDSFSGDIGVHYKNERELLSGTIFLKNISKVRLVIDEWANLQQRNPMQWDQKILQLVLDKQKNLNIINIPATYTQIFDTMKDVGEPVIEHFQASRRLKTDVRRMYNG